MKLFNKSILLGITIVILAVVLMFIHQPIPAILILGLYIICKFYIRKYVRVARKANKAYINKNYETALKYFEEAAFIPSCSAKIISNFIFLTLKQGNPDKILEQIDDILSKNTSLKTKERNFITLHKALVYWKFKDLDNALKVSEEIYTVDKEPFTYELYGFFLIQKGDLDKALKVNLEGTKIPKATNVITTNVGETYFKLGKIEESEAIFSAQIKKRVKFVEPHYFMGIIQHMHGDDEAALSTLESALYCPISLLTSISGEDIKNKILEIKPDFRIDAD